MAHFARNPEFISSK